jgi:hypothetical protein
MEKLTGEGRTELGYIFVRLNMGLASQRNSNAERESAHPLKIIS